MPRQHAAQHWGRAGPCRWRLLVEAGRKAGHTYSQPDLMIAATGLHHGMTIVTRDTGDYERTGVPLLNPWNSGK